MKNHFQENLFLPDGCEMEEKKSAIFSLPFHNHRVKRDLSFSTKTLGRLIYLTHH